MTQILITLNDQASLPNIRRIVKSLQGVTKVVVKTDEEATVGGNHLRLNARVTELSSLCDGWDGADSKAVSPKLVRKFKEQIARIDDKWLEGWTLFPEAHGYLYLDYSGSGILAGITMTEGRLTYFIKKNDAIEKGENKIFSNTNLKAILKKVI